MQPRNTVQTVLISLLLSFSFLSPAQATLFSNASYAGKAHGPGCGNGFTDVKGKCWVCPKGYKHNNILLHPTHKKVCKKKGRRINKKGIEVGKAKFMKCERGWISLNNRKCYVCPKGYKHNKKKFGTSSGVCYKKIPNRYSAAMKTGGSLVCNRGHFSARKGGSCWTCPKYAPKRTWRTVHSEKACASTCSKGQFRNFITNECVSINLKEAACKAFVTALKAGEVPAGILQLAKRMKSKSNKKTKKTKNQNLLDNIANDISPFKTKVPEIKRLYASMNSNQASVKKLFDPDTFCSKRVAKKKLNSLSLKPTFMKKSSSSRHFYMAYTLSFSIAAGGGLQGGYTLVTDYNGNTGAYVFLGPQVVTNATVSDSFGVQFFPKTQLADFDGWGYGIGVSGGPPTKIVGAGADVAFDEKFKFQGFGVSGSVGLGAIPGDVGIAATHAWKMF